MERALEGDRTGSTGMAISIFPGLIYQHRYILTYASDITGMVQVDPLRLLQLTQGQGDCSQIPPGDAAEPMLLHHWMEMH